MTWASQAIWAAQVAQGLQLPKLPSSYLCCPSCPQFGFQLPVKNGGSAALTPTSPAINCALIAASRDPPGSQTSELSELLSRSRNTFVIVAQHQISAVECYTITKRACIKNIRVLNTIAY